MEATEFHSCREGDITSPCWLMKFSGCCGKRPVSLAQQGGTTMTFASQFDGERLHDGRDPEDNEEEIRENIGNY